MHYLWVGCMAHFHKVHTSSVQIGNIPAKSTLGRICLLNTWIGLDLHKNLCITEWMQNWRKTGVFLNLMKTSKRCWHSSLASQDFLCTCCRKTIHRCEKLLWKNPRYRQDTVIYCPSKFKKKQIWCWRWWWWWCKRKGKRCSSAC